MTVKGDSRATVESINQRNGLIAVKTESGFYTVVERISGYLDVGDVLFGDLSSPGPELLRNQSKDDDVAVFVQAGGER